MLIKVDGYINYISQTDSLNNNVPVDSLYDSTPVKNTFYREFSTYDSLQNTVWKKIHDKVMNENWCEYYDINRVVPVIRKHPRTGAALNALKIFPLSNIYDSVHTDDDFFMIGRTPRMDKIPGITSLKMYLKQHLKRRADLIAEEVQLSEKMVQEDSDGRGNSIEFWRWDNRLVDSNLLIFSEDDFNV